MIFVMKFAGNVMKRLGRARDGSRHGEFEEPTNVALNHEHVFELDARGTRVDVMDHEGKAMRSFPIPHGSDPNMNRENGLGTDHSGNRLYVADAGNGRVQLFQLKATERGSSAEKVAEAPAGRHSASSEDKSTLRKQ